MDQELAIPKKVHLSFPIYFLVVFVVPCALLANRLVRESGSENQIFTAISASIVVLCFIAIQEYKIFPHEEKLPWKLYVPLFLNLVVALFSFGVDDVVYSLAQGFSITFAATMVYSAVLNLKFIQRQKKIAQENSQEFTSTFLHQYWKNKASKSDVLGGYAGVVGMALLATYLSYDIVFRNELVVADTRGKLVIAGYFIFSVICVIWSYHHKDKKYAA